jgi:hypothetical protein
MSKGFGDFTAEAYDALREAYADQMTAPLEEENEGYDLQGQNYKLETIDARAEYLDQTGLWQYPSGNSDYEKPDPDSLITSLEVEKGDADIDALIDEILGEEEDDEFTGYDGESTPIEEKENEEASE